MKVRLLQSFYFFVKLYSVFWLTFSKSVYQDNILRINWLFHVPEADVRRSPVEKVFLETSQNSQEKNLCQSLFAQVFSCEFCEISKDIFI